MTEETRPVVWTVRAQGELRAIRAYVGAVNPLAAQRLALRITAAADTLAYTPYRFRSAGRARELVAVKPYIIRYRVEADRVLILRVRHAARRSLRGT